VATENLAMKKKVRKISAEIQYGPLIPEFASLTMKLWFQVEVGVDVFIHLLRFVYSSLDLGPLFRGH
jgi:hypothetical protein